MSGCVDLSQGEFVMILVAQYVHQVCVKRMNVLQIKTKSNYWIHLRFTVQTIFPLYQFTDISSSLFYRPQTKFAKVMFLQVSVCPHGGACVVFSGGEGSCVGYDEIDSCFLQRVCSYPFWASVGHLSNYLGDQNPNSVEKSDPHWRPDDW